MTRRRPPLAVLAVFVAMVQVTGTFFAAHRTGAALGAPALVLLLAGPALLLLRRRAPGPMAAGIGAVTGLYVLAGFPWGPFPLSLALGLVLAVAAGRRWWAWGTGVGIGVLFLVLALRAGLADRAWFVAVWLALVLLVGELVGMAAERRTALRRAAEERARHRRDEERLVLARDIHDVVAHSLSMINVQASVALHLSRKDGDARALREAMENIKAGSKEALDEVRDVLAVLRQDAPRVPSQRLEQLAELVQRVRGAHLEVDFRPPRLPPPAWVDERVENTVYRVVQESLTNAVRHARAGRIEVRIELAEDGARVTVQDDGIGLGASDEGNGLSGMRERVASRGGTLELTAAAPGFARPDRPGTRIGAWIPAPRQRGTEPAERGKP
ncbi:histidine kinase [Paeniglutamicibacter sp. R2-26]|uniref:sensor histidine kinase n=1 Tax=Paeniglutamicibacter sp. R2-26 TaxID=3144417 RepID=UPI003EE7A5C2